MTATAWLSTETVDAISKESGNGRYVNPSKLEEGKEHRFRFFGTGITGFETWTTDNKPVRFREKPEASDLPENVRLDNGSPTIKRFISGLVYDYQAEQFKILNITQKTLMNDLFKYIKDSDYGDPVNYDVKLTRKGSGMNTEYDLVAAPPKDPAKSIVALYEEEYCNLDALFDNGDPFDQPKG